ncbi:MAG: hypothetical protein ACR2JM_05080 [Mycobacterium sp.]
MTIPPQGPPPQPYRPGYPEPPTQKIPTTPVPPLGGELPYQPPAAPETEEPVGRGWRGDPLYIALVLVIVSEMGVSALLGGVLFSLH